MERKYIVYGAGKCGEKCLKKYGLENVYCFVDANKTGQCLGKEIISLDKLGEIWDSKKFKMIIAIKNIDIAWEVFEALKRMNIYVNNWEGKNKVIHVYKNDCRISYDYDENSINSWRVLKTIQMLQEMFVFYKDRYKNVKFDFYIYYWDDVFEASKICDLLGIDSIFSYSEIFGVDNVISIPDYRFAINWIYGKNYYTDVIRNLKKMGKWEDERAFWTGNLDNNKMRRVLLYLGEKYKEKLYINACVWRDDKIVEGKFMPPEEWGKFKYLIDIRGYGWTDRVKYLLAMRRPLLLVDRPYKEYYFRWLKPMVHYVPIKEDLSDLIEQIAMLDSSPELYDKISNNAFEFVEKYFNKDMIRQQLSERIDMMC